MGKGQLEKKVWNKFHHAASGVDDDDDDPAGMMYEVQDLGM